MPGLSYHWHKSIDLQIMLCDNVTNVFHTTTTKQTHLGYTCPRIANNEVHVMILWAFCGTIYAIFPKMFLCSYVIHVLDVTPTHLPLYTCTCKRLAPPVYWTVISKCPWAHTQDINMVLLLIYTAVGALCSVGNDQYCYPTSCQSGLCQHVQCISSHSCLVF